jgi:D-2-hydroxyacid dehydrogenase (NADP+)
VADERKKVLVAVRFEEKLLHDIRKVDPKLEVEVLDAEGAKVYWQAGRDTSEAANADLASLLADVEILYGFVGSTEQAQALLASAPKLRWFQASSAGVDELIGAGFTERGITVTTASGVHSTPIGEFALHLMLMFAKHAAASFRAQQEKRWYRFMGDELRDATVGVVGLGHIGREVARLAKAFGCRVIAVDRAQADVEGVDETMPLQDLGRFLGESDYVVLAVPLSNETRHMIGKPELQAMKRSGVLINICRGSVVDEAGLVHALREGWIAGAGLDVFEQEPLPPESPLWEMENVIISGHSSGANAHYYERAVPIFCENLRRYLKGGPLLNLVEPDRGY